MSRYFQLTRKHSYALLFALPLLVLYELGAQLISGPGGGLRNGADVLLRTVLAAGGVHSTLAFTSILVVGAAILIARERRREKVPLHAGVFGGMAVESVLYALVFGTVIGMATAWVTNAFRLAAVQGSSPMERLPIGESLVMAFGAGFYEELLFRVLLVGGLLAVFKSAGFGRTTGRVWAAVLAAFLFSAFHYIGPYAYPLELGSFVFRFLSGLALNALFIARGFGIAAWTHALYDVFVMVLHRG
jgi:membrane protease YdiL (CAAX protease family)